MMKRVKLAIAAFGCLFAFSTAGAFAADATIDQVYKAAQSGHLQDAQQMMDQVLKDHPNSAKAHFVEAQLRVREQRLEDARSELQLAEKLEPGLPFAKPEAVDELRGRLAGRSQFTPAPISVAPTAVAPSAVMPNASSGTPWVTILLVGGVVVAVVLILRMVTRARFAAAGPGAYGATSPGYGPSYGQPPMGPMGPMGPTLGSGGMGSGILGGLATGAAVGAGVVAGEALMHRVLDGGSPVATPVEGGHFQPIDDTPLSSGSNYDMGGGEFGVSDSGSWDDGSSSGGSDDWN